MNALFVELRAGEQGMLAATLLDFHGGLEDILAGQIRCVGIPGPL